MRRRLALAALLVVAGCGTGGGAGAGQPPGTAEVVRVIDGDTIVVRIGSAEERVRLLGIDTPESVDPRSPVECYGPEASQRTAELLPPGTPIRLVRDVEGRDRYSRLLAYVYRADDGAFVNLDLVRRGFADVLSVAPNLAHADELASAAESARGEGAGLWSAC
ncbi:MAG TPA: thermonuclease family protein [Acidimicrobiales bacterium]|nr:thermonuclease family protein [Acidimicrobiales bacterium]